MATITWRYTDDTQTVVAAAFEDGRAESHLVTADVIQAWIKAGNTPLPYEPPAVDLKAAAQTALDKSDITLLRCYEAGRVVSAEWATYRGQLRDIVNGTRAATELPVRPAYPA